METATGSLRIGEFARRVGVSAELLRAWERRYGLLHPVRSPAGYRLYTQADAERVQRMRRGMDTGLSAAEAAQQALEGPQLSLAGGDGAVFREAGQRLLEAVRAYDEAEIHQILDDGLAAFGLQSALLKLVLPALDELGDRWESGKLDISQEHFASVLIRSRLLALGRQWGRGHGPLALLACPPGEAHDIGLICFGLLLRSHSWRILFLGADTPVSTVAHAAAMTHPTLVVVASQSAPLLAAEAAGLRQLSADRDVVLAGPGATPAVCAEVGVRCLSTDLMEAVAMVAG